MVRSNRWFLGAGVAATLAMAGLAGQRDTEAQPRTGDVTGSVTASSHRLLANAVVSVQRAPGTFRPPRQPVAINQHGLVFSPRVLPVVKGTTVRFLNGDSVDHNVYSPEGHYDLGHWSAGAHRDQVFGQLGVFTQLCHLHPAMIAYVVVLSNPYFAVTDAAGAFRIHGVPPGSYQLVVWQEQARGGPIPVTVTAGGTAQVQIPVTRHSG
jgi:plastocyanin